MKHYGNRVLSPDSLRSLYLPEVGTTDEIARHLWVSNGTVARHIREGRLVGRKVGRRWYVTRRALLAFLEEPVNQRVAAKPLSLVCGDEPGGDT